jgi:outer membrane biosynthesis protein TonB
MELYLVVVLVALLYFKPSFLAPLVNNMISKLALLVGVIYLAHNHGVSSGMLGAFIMILLIHNVIEGVDETLEETPKEEDNESDDEEDSDSDDEEEKTDKHHKSDQLDNEEQLKSELVSTPEKEQNAEPEGVATDSKTTEGFSLYY